MRGAVFSGGEAGLVQQAAALNLRGLAACVNFGERSDVCGERIEIAAERMCSMCVVDFPTLNQRGRHKFRLLLARFRCVVHVIAECIAAKRQSEGVQIDHVHAVLLAHAVRGVIVGFDVRSEPSDAEVAPARVDRIFDGRGAAPNDAGCAELTSNCKGLLDVGDVIADIDLQPILRPLDVVQAAIEEQPRASQGRIAG